MTGPDAYEIEKVYFGSGGFAQVHKAVCKADNKVVAVKMSRVLYETFTDQEKQDVEQEIELQKTLNHDFIVKCLDSFIKSGRACAVLEFYPEGDL